MVGEDIKAPPETYHLDLDNNLNRKIIGVNIWLKYRLKEGLMM